MDTAQLLLITLFALTIGLLVTLKLCSLQLDHRTAPLFTSFWTLLGMAVVSPLYGHLLAPGWRAMTGHPLFLALAVVKGLLLYALFVVSQALMQRSLSSRHYVTPLSIGLLTLGNAFLGEHLKPHEWFSALGLCALATGFFLKGHLSDLDRRARFSYLFLVVLSAGLGTIDQTVTKGTNWYALLLVSNVALFTFSLGLSLNNLAIVRAAFLHRSAALAGFFYAATELVKFYQQVTINPVSVVVTV